MKKIHIEHQPDAKQLNEMKVQEWPVWTKEVSEFPWEYDAEETCYVLEGQITVTPEDGEPVEIGPGDLATFPKGMRCTWKVSAPVRKHYTFS